MDINKQATYNSICFGLNRKTDEQSLSVFLKLFSRDQLLNTLLPRLNEEEIEEIVQLLTKTMHNHLRNNEYHNLFLDAGDK